MIRSSPKSISTKGPLNAQPALFIKTEGHPYLLIASLTQCSISRGLDKSHLTRLIFDLWSTVRS